MGLNVDPRRNVLNCRDNSTATEKILANISTCLSCHATKTHHSPQCPSVATTNSTPIHAHTSGQTVQQIFSLKVTMLRQNYPSTQTKQSPSVATTIFAPIHGHTSRQTTLQIFSHRPLPKPRNTTNPQSPSHPQCKNREKNPHQPIRTLQLCAIRQG